LFDRVDNMTDNLQEEISEPFYCILLIIHAYNAGIS
jgi:hypothetical protein